MPQDKSAAPTCACLSGRWAVDVTIHHGLTIKTSGKPLKGCVPPRLSHCRLRRARSAHDAAAAASLASFPAVNIGFVWHISGDLNNERGISQGLGNTIRIRCVYCPSIYVFRQLSYFVCSLSLCSTWAREMVGELHTHPHPPDSSTRTLRPKAETNIPRERRVVPPDGGISRIIREEECTFTYFLRLLTWTGTQRMGRSARGRR